MNTLYQQLPPPPNIRLGVNGLSYFAEGMFEPGSQIPHQEWAGDLLFLLTC